MTGRPVSLQGRLLALVLGIVLAGGISGSVASYIMAEQTADELFDGQLAQAAQTLLAIVERGNDQIAYEPAEIAHRYQQKLMFQVWELVQGEFHLILRSQNAPTDLLPSAVDHIFSTAEWNGHQWRFYAEVDAHRDTRVIVAQNLDIRRELARSIAWQNLLPFLIGVPALALLLLLAIRRSLHPLSALANELEHRAPTRLDPVTVANPPLELQPVLKALEDLFGKVATALANERRFTADAAHELRTPLAALSVQLQVAMKTPDVIEQRLALEKCKQGIGNMTHLVHQMLTLARIDATSHLPQFEPVDVAVLIRSVCADLRVEAVAKNIAVEIDAPAGVTVRGLPDLLHNLVRNLVDNAIRYTPPLGNVHVGVSRDENLVRIEVSDSGPGVPAEQLELLGCRFHRLDDATDEGVGLGLSIVRRIATLHAADVTFGASPGGIGLQVTVALPAGNV